MEGEEVDEVEGEEVDEVEMEEMVGEDAARAPRVGDGWDEVGEAVHRQQFQKGGRHRLSSCSAQAQ